MSRIKKMVKSISFTKIILHLVSNYASSASKCHIGANEKKCTKESFLKYFQILIHLKRRNIADVKRESGCYPKCRYTIYTLEAIENTRDGNSNWTSEVFIQPKSSEVKFSTEYYSFDRNDLISSIGGTIGVGKEMLWIIITLVTFLMTFYRKVTKTSRISNRAWS